MLVIPQHMGAAHAIEWALSFALILGPLVALGVAIVVIRRRDAREAEAESVAAGRHTDRAP
jgi:hypothetical protein